MKDFKKLIIWQKGMVIVRDVYKSCVFFPKEELYGMRSQVTRAAVAIPSNIAEGSAKKSQKEYKHCLETSPASAFELETHLLIVEDQKWFPDQTIGDLLAKVTEEQKMLSVFINRIEA
jgi:four helix bundle protein